MLSRRDPLRNGEATSVSAVDGILAKLRASGGRITATRRTTIEVLVTSGDHRHLIAEDIASEVRARLPDVAESTIYRTLSALEDLGVITHVHMGHGPSTFHLVDDAHQHLVCQRCGTVVEADANHFRALRATLRDRTGFDADFRHFAITGTCAACRTKSSS